MDASLIELAAASTALVGTHFALSHPLRASLVGMLGEKGFMAVYSLVALASMGWMIVAFRAAPSADLGSSGDLGWVVATLLTLPALALFAGSFRGNPALPEPGAAKSALREPAGAFRVTRHPMMWGFALWALSHLVLWWSVRTLIVALAVLVLALVGAHLQDRKKAVQLGEAWATWEGRTSYWPRWGQLGAIGAAAWAIAFALWLGLSWAHLPTAGIPAGLWRWF
jgi:uncharacterized membrane protein